MDNLTAFLTARKIAESSAIIDDLEDDPSEAIAFALASSMFEMRIGSNIDALLHHADVVHDRLRALGYCIVKGQR